MAVILKRTVYVDDAGGLMRFHEWAKVITPLGTMVEPFQQIGGKGALEHEWEDEITRVDAIKSYKNGAAQTILADGHIHGGFLPRA